MAGASTGTQDAVREAVAPVLARIGLRLDDVAVSAAGSRRLLRVAVDVSEEAVEQALERDASAPVPGLSLDAVADASRAVSEVLDASDVMGESAYVLEVTTPGVDRPLTTPAQIRRHVHRKVTLTLRDGTEVTGRLQEAGDAGPSLRVEGAKKGMTSTTTFGWDDVVRGVVQVDFSRVDEAPLVDVGDDGSDEDADDEGTEG